MKVWWNKMLIIAVSTLLPWIHLCLLGSNKIRDGEGRDDAPTTRDN